MAEIKYSVKLRAVFTAAEPGPWKTQRIFRRGGFQEENGKDSVKRMMEVSHHIV
jgi:hypothetical protein